MTAAPYTTQLQAGLGLVNETKVLLDLWSPGMSGPKLYEVALQSGRFPTVSARRLRNVVMECFAPRYLVDQARPAAHLKKMSSRISSGSFLQLLLLFTCRANPILGDFVRTVYWGRYEAGAVNLSNEDSRKFVEHSIDDKLTSKRWSASTVKRVSAYLTGCCADYGLLERSQRSSKRISAFRVSSDVAAYLAHDLHFRGVGDNALLVHRDWLLFGLDRGDVLEELKKVALTGTLMVQAAGDAVKVSWKKPDMEALCDVLANS
jgi:hypothetical protein